MVKPSPCFILLKAKWSKNCQPLSEASPRGEGVAERRRMRGVAYYAKPIFDIPNISEEISKDQGAKPIFDFPNISEEISEDQGAQLVFWLLLILPMIKPSPRGEGVAERRRMRGSFINGMIQAV